VSNPDAIKKALKEGADSRMLCMTCSWDRLCLTPPSMTAGDIEEQMNKMAQPKEGSDKGENIMGSLMGALIYAGKDTQATLCPVMVNRLHSSDGRKIVDQIRSMMVEWTE
jgi:hypothetical protein